MEQQSVRKTQQPVGPSLGHDHHLVTGAPNFTEKSNLDIRRKRKRKRRKNKAVGEGLNFCHSYDDNEFRAVSLWLFTEITKKCAGCLSGSYSGESHPGNNA